MGDKVNPVMLFNFSFDKYQRRSYGLVQAYYELKRSFLGYNVHYTPALPVGPPMRVPRMWGVDRDHRASLGRQGVHGETDR